MGIGNGFLNMTLIAQEMIARIDRWNCIKLKTLLLSKQLTARHGSTHL
jgi:hypothetical protein